MLKSRPRSRTAALVVSLVMAVAALLSPILLTTPAGADTVSAPKWPACESLTVYQYTPFSRALNASDATSYTLLSGALPSGITLDPATGIVSGTTEKALGASSITVRAANTSGATKRIIAITSLPEQTPTWSSVSLTPGVAGQPFTGSITAAFATLYSMHDNTLLPPGLVIDPPTGDITGTPTTAGDYVFTVRATNHAEYADTSVDLQILPAGTAVTPPTVAPPAPPRWQTTTVPSGTRGRPYSGTLTAEGAQGFAVTAGALPEGLTLDETTGALCGTPTATGDSSFVVTATNSLGSTDQTFTLTVAPPAPVWQDVTLPDAVAGAAYNDAVTASDTDAYAITAGALPSGLALDSATGAITGAPLLAGSGSFTITASNSAASVSRDFAMRVGVPIAPPLPESAPVAPVLLPTVTPSVAAHPTDSAAPAAVTEASATKPASGGFGGLGLIAIVAAVVLGGGLFAGFGGGGSGGKSWSGL